MLEGGQARFCSRPGKATRGIPSSTEVNYFPIVLKEKGDIHHFDVIILPEVHMKVNLAVFEQFERQHIQERASFENTCLVYDGMKSAFSPRPMPFGKSFQVEIELPNCNGGNKRAQAPSKFMLKLREVKAIRVDINDMHSETSSGLAAIAAFNVVFIYSLKSRFTTFNNSSYAPEGAKPMSGGLEVWPGFFRSFVSTADGYALNVDTSSCVFYRPGSLLDLLVAFVGLRRREELLDPRFWQHVKRIQAFIKNLRVVFNYRDGTTHEYKILGMSATGADSTKFTYSEEGRPDRQISVQEHFAKKFGIRLEFPGLPCIEVKKGNLIPMELCRLAPGQRYTKKLDETQTAEMIKITCLSPSQRSERILHSLKLMDTNHNIYLKKFGIQVVPTLKKVDSRILPAPCVLYHPSSRDSVLRPVDGAWNLRDKKVFEGMELHTWAVVVFASETRVRRSVVDTFMVEHMSTCKATGMPITNSRPKIYYAPPLADKAGQVLWDIFVNTGNEAKKRPQLLFCILPDKGAELYGAIKTACEIELGIPTQCIQSEKIFRPNKQYCANVCLKMNAKLGGVNATMQERDLADLKNPPTLLIGADTSTLPSGIIDAHSVAAVTGSIDFAACRYASEVSIQKGKDDYIVDLERMVGNLLKTFYKFSSAKPVQIVYFRAGVSHSQFQAVVDHELMSIKRACRSIEENYNPNVTFIVIQKRHHTRFLPTDKSATDRSGNCKAGTLVETGICHPFNFDFLLQSHSGLQGTSRPIHYYVLVDEINFSANNLQKLCYNLCYLFNRATRSVSIVPPLYYAHLAATRTACHYKSIELGGFSSANSFSQSATGKPTSICLRQELYSVMYYI